MEAGTLFNKYGRQILRAELIKHGTVSTLLLLLHFIDHYAPVVAFLSRLDWTSETSCEIDGKEYTSSFRDAKLRTIINAESVRMDGRNAQTKKEDETRAKAGEICVFSSRASEYRLGFFELCRLDEQ